MKVVVTFLAIMALAAGALAVGGEHTCPADRAKQAGHDVFGEFHHVMAQAWHQAWPSKDYDALIAAGPVFKEKFAGIAALEPEFKTEARMVRFEENRKQFAELVDAYATAAEAKDNVTVYKLMPDLHDAFEMTASALLPISYPEVDNVVITLNLIRENHMPHDNTEGIIGSTETLHRKVAMLNEETIPEDLASKKDEILVQFKEWKKLAAHMEECCKGERMEHYEEDVAKLAASIEKFLEMYL